jgi:N-methylhydantoinase A
VRQRLDALPEARERASAAARPATAPVVLGSGARVEARLVDAAALATGDAIHGPALVEGYSSTLWVPPGWHAARDAAGNILMRRCP